KKEGKFACIMGNHEDDQEEGNPVLDKQTLQYCNDHWYRKIANNTTLLIGLNTNGDTKLQTKWGQSLVTNSTIMKENTKCIIISNNTKEKPNQSKQKKKKSRIRQISVLPRNITMNTQ